MPRFNLWPVQVGFVVDKVALGWGFLWVLHLPLSVSFHWCSMLIYSFITDTVCCWHLTASSNNTVNCCLKGSVLSTAHSILCHIRGWWPIMNWKGCGRKMLQLNWRCHCGTSVEGVMKSVNFMFGWTFIMNYVYNNQLDGLFILSLLNQDTSTCFRHQQPIIRR
jgi:hypothetical protein